MSNKLDKQYQTLLQTILDFGVEKKDRTGTGTKSIFGYTIRHNMKDGFPLLTTKKVHFKSVVTELLWFLRGDTNIKYLVDNGCNIWDGDAYKNYCNKCNEDEWMKEIILDLPFPNKSYGLYSQEEFINKIKTDDEFANKWGELGPVYGKQWRQWSRVTYNNEHRMGFSNPIDQIANLISELKTNPDSRRLMVNAWNVGELDQMVLPPCHYGFQVYTRELSLDERLDLMRKRTRDGTVDYDNRHHGFLDYHNIPKRAISLMWNQRSVDTFLGLPFNIASYGLLLQLIAKAVNMLPDELIGNLGDVHLYLNHIEQAKEQIGQPIFEESPTLYTNGPMNEGIKKQIVVGRTREPFPLPTLDIHPGILDYDLDKLEIDMFKIENYQSHPAIKAPLSN